jgi:hypothetical protein
MTPDWLYVLAILVAWVLGHQNGKKGRAQPEKEGNDV